MKETKPLGHSGKDEETGSSHHPGVEWWQSFFFFLDVIVAPFVT